MLDDAFQHLKLNRDINLVLLDDNSPFGNGHLFPKGTLREPISSIARMGGGNRQPKGKTDNY